MNLRNQICLGLQMLQFFQRWKMLAHFSNIFSNYIKSQILINHAYLFKCFLFLNNQRQHDNSKICYSKSTGFFDDIYIQNLQYFILKLMSQYGRAQYWQQRYSRDPASFDWYQRYFSLRQIIGTNIPVQYRILNVGSGNSRLSQEMFDDGYENITNIDISQTSIKLMNELYKEKGANFKYLQMDVRAMEFAQNSFEAVIDKGTFDSVICGQGSNTNANKMLAQIYRVLGPNGVYIMVSFANQDTRLQYLKRKQFQWGIWTHKIMKPTVSTQITPSNAQNDDKNYHHIYVCVKGKKNQQPAPVVQEKK